MRRPSRYELVLPTTWLLTIGCGRSVVGGDAGDASGPDVPADVGDTPAATPDLAAAPDLPAPAPDRPDASDDATADTGVSPGSARCESAPPLVDGTIVETEDLAGATVRVRGCFASPTGPGRFYRATVGSFDTLSVHVRPLAEGAALMPAVRILTGCDADRCITQRIHPATGGATAWTNYTDTPQPVVVVVANAADVPAGRYRLEATLGRGSGNATCARAVRVTPGVPLRDQSFGDASDALPLCPGSTGTSGPSVFYRVTAPPRQALEITAQLGPGVAVSNSPRLRLIDACDAAACVAASGRTAAGTQGLRWFNEASTPRELILAVSTATTTLRPRFDLVVEAVGAPPEALCAGALEVSVASPRRTQSNAAAVAPPPACVGPAGVGNAVWYRTVVPPDTLLQARVTRTSGATDPQLRIYDACGGTCVASSGRWSNERATPATVYLAVSSAAGAVMGFDVDVGLVAAAPNVRCADATVLTAGARLPREELVSAVQAPPACAGAPPSNPALWYAVTVPTGRTLAVTARRVAVPGDTAAWAPQLRLVSGCGAADRCLQGSDSGGEAGTAHLVARGAGGPALLAVMSSSATASGPVELTVDLSPPPTNLSCDAAEELAPIEHRTGVLLGDGGPAAPVCGAGATGTALHYRVAVAPGATLTAYAARASGSGWSPQLDLSSSCVGGACLAMNELLSGATFLRWTNPGSRAQDARLTVYTSTPQPGAAVTFSTAVETPRYVVERVTADCEAVTEAWSPVGVTASNGASPHRSLPFAFRYFGDLITHFSASANGFAQLWTGTSRAPVGTAANLAIPTPGAPPGLAAPLWDQFTFSTTASRVVALETPGEQRHLTVAWSNLTLASRPTSFQLKLFANTDVVEFHYCSLEPSTGDVTTGAQATVGLQDATGLRGVLHSFNTARAVTSGGALRFLPVR